MAAMTACDKENTKAGNLFLALQSNSVVKVVLNIAVLCMGMRCTNYAGLLIVSTFQHYKLCKG
jgi:hypothetical protein